MLAIVAAFAFTERSVNTGEYGQHQGIWYDVTEVDPSSTTYQCDPAGNGCLYDEPFGMGQVISSVSDRVFVKKGDLPLAE